MKLQRTGMLSLLLAAFTGLAQAALQLLPGDHPASVFGGAPSSISVTFSNSSGQDFTAEIRTRIYQTSSATAVLVSEAAWKPLRVLPQQTVLESARLDFPAVRAETRFVVQWLESSNHLLGITTVMVYPTNLLAELRPLPGEVLPGVLDPNHELKPLLQQNGVAFVDLSEMPLEDFSGRLAILGPFLSKLQMRDGLASTIHSLARKGTAVIWIQPPPGPKDKLKPSFYVVPEGKGVVIVVQPDLVADFSKNPESQLHLNYLCQLALHPAPLPMPDLSPPP